MKLRTRLDVFTAALLSALGASSVVACGGSTTFTKAGNGGAAGDDGGGGTPSGGSPGNSGSHSGGASNGGSAHGGASNAGASNGGASNGGAVSSAGSSNQYPCKNPMDLGNGVISCDGFTHLDHTEKCESHVPRAEPVTPPVGGVASCKMDSDCKERAYGWCGTSNGQIQGTFCNYGCVTNADCAEKQVCLCGEPVGHCQAADCKSDADCSPGFLCKGYDSSGGCNFTNFTCQSAADTCGSDADCTGNSVGNLCRFDIEAKHFKCDFGGCAIGRPFLVEGEQRLAPVASRADWCELALLPRLERLDAELSTHVADRWTRVALMEHASIAAFARFSLQLLSLGAPPELVELATSAMADETKHAKACFAVASAYAGAPVGPGRLSVERSLNELSLREIVLTTIHEGCVGETVAAIEAREAAEHTADPALRALLLVISDDETRHAELAFRFVKWALAQGDLALEAAVRAEFALLSGETTAPKNPPSSLHREALRHGIVPDSMRAMIRHQAVRDVILPCARALLGGRGQQDLVAAADGEHVRVAPRVMNAVAGRELAVG